METRYYQSAAKTSLERNRTLLLAFIFDGPPGTNTTGPASVRKFHDIVRIPTSSFIRGEGKRRI